MVLLYHHHLGVQLWPQDTIESPMWCYVTSGDVMLQVSFVDLAGSERVKDTKTAGGMLKETSAINRSLFTLGKVEGNPCNLVSG